LKLRNSLWTCLLVVCPSSFCLSKTDDFIYVAARRLFAEISVELQLLPFLLIQQEAVYVGEELIRRYRGNEAFSVHSTLVQQQHAEVGSGDSEYLPAEKRNTH